MSFVHKLSNISRYILGMMGGNDSKYISEAELSDSEASLSEYDTPPAETDDLTVTTDAALRRYVSLPKAQEVLNPEKVLEIERQLDMDEIVSLIFLLLDDEATEVDYYLQALSILLSGSSKKLLHEWSLIQESKAGSNWQNKLIESLCIIRNYKILKTLGFPKDDVKNHFLPHVRTTLHISKIRKALYLMCEKLTAVKTVIFLEQLQKKFSEENISFSLYDQQFLELCILKLEKIRNFSLNDVKSVLKIMEEEELYTMLCDVLENNAQSQNSPNSEDRFTNSRNIDDFFKSSHSTTAKASLGRHSSNTSMDNLVRQEFIDSNHAFMDYQLPHVGLASGSAHSDMSLKDNRYHIDQKNPGVVLIIDQENFYKEVDPKYKHLLPPSMSRNLDMTLEWRKGTEIDKKELEKVFCKFGFRVIAEENLSHLRMVQRIKKVLNSIVDESSLFICILSHGDKGVVYGANSCMVQVNEIKKLMDTVNKTNLSGKPKVLILQSCQGLECQKMGDEEEGDGNEEEDDNEEDNALTTDGPAPLFRDMFTFYASVPGYAAIRNKNSGSWFIQAFCNQMVQAGNRHHFADICTRTANEVTTRYWRTTKEKKTMTPIVESTFSKAFYLPPMRKSDKA